MSKEADSFEPTADAVFDAAQAGDNRDNHNPLALTAEDAGKLLFLIDCAVRYTPQPSGGLNMASDAMALAQKLSMIQQSNAQIG